jgi:hypothetical protein
MRGILAISALHLAYFQPERREFFTVQATLQSQAGLRAATLILPNLTCENCSAIYIFSVLTCIYTLASPRKPGDLLVLGSTGVAEWLTLFRGTVSVIESFIVNSSDDALKFGVLGPMIIAGARRAALRDAHASAAKRSTEEGQLGELRQVFREAVTDPHMLQVYMDAIDELQKSFTVAYKDVSQMTESTNVFIFLFRVSEEYLLSLQQRTQESLAIFAYFCVIAKRLDTNWWSEGWSNHLLSRVYAELDDEHRLWIRWPIEEIGWVPDHYA